MNISYSRQAVKAIGRMDTTTKQRIRAAIDGIPQGDIKPLMGYSDGRTRLRIGKYRIVFCYVVENTEEVLYIMDVGSRGDIYK